jgi:hypothetical protein
MAAATPADVEGRRRIMEQLTMLSGEREVAARLRAGSGPHLLHPELQVISLGEGCGVLGLPGEFFAETARMIRQAADIEYLLVACYTNHHIFYVVPRAAFGQGGYEPGVAVLDETAEETFRLAAIDALRSASAG